MLNENHLAELIKYAQTYSEHTIVDWETTDRFFQILSDKWGPFSIASHDNTKVRCFNSRFFSPFSSGNYDFAQSWEGQNNFVVPPVRDIIKVIQKITVEDDRVF